jgi:hypothetical protein
MKRIICTGRAWQESRTAALGTWVRCRRWATVKVGGRDYCSDCGAAQSPAPRTLVVFDGTDWFLRKVRAIEHDLDKDEKVYRCDEHIGGPFQTLDSAVATLHVWLEENAHE